MKAMSACVGLGTGEDFIDGETKNETVLSMIHIQTGLAFSVTIFCTEAMVTIGILLLRRHKSIGGELGGEPKMKYATATVMFSLWLIYLILSTLEAYDIIEGF